MPPPDDYVVFVDEPETPITPTTYAPHGNVLCAQYCQTDADCPSYEWYAKCGRTDDGQSTHIDCPRHSTITVPGTCITIPCAANANFPNKYCK